MHSLYEISFFVNDFLRLLKFCFMKKKKPSFWKLLYPSILLIKLFFRDMMYLSHFSASTFFVFFRNNLRQYILWNFNATNLSWRLCFHFEFMKRISLFTEINMASEYIKWYFKSHWKLTAILSSYCLFGPKMTTGEKQKKKCVFEIYISRSFSIFKLFNSTFLSVFWEIRFK